ncbi:histidine phosphatase family protein [Nocardioides zeicaulis]|uniref:Histidine phosphatase family protein n=1 Tax=Nocardioides zeicaulis TaxID=1776857 RepID=A0ABV6DXH8_9ACTN
MTLHLVRHGRPLVVPGVPAAEWDLDPAAYDDVWALRASGRLPARAAWFSSAEPKAQQTAELLTDAGFGVLPDLGEHVRSAEWVEDLDGAVRRAFASPDEPALPGWEPLSSCRDRVVPAVRRVLEVHGDDDVVLVGHGTAWTLVVADLTGEAPDVDRWAGLAMPDLITVATPPRT